MEDSYFGRSGDESDSDNNEKESAPAPAVPDYEVKYEEGKLLLSKELQEQFEAKLEALNQGKA